eukprot:TRINITY_DN5397_c0_g1_i1.p1 TRINITY_DN5397_c0_g1~~TRINITY_DN5397_c0_g1_i1.p1  ORF type:complete len:1647 (-),score=359.92 TRINITY_DN5397_c0_g1_i1:145-5085(-)
MRPSLILLFLSCSCLFSLLQAQVFVDNSVICVILDDDVISQGDANEFLAIDINKDIARPGLRRPLKWFAENIGARITLSAGTQDNEGWFAMISYPNVWDLAGPTLDGARNFFGVFDEEEGPTVSEQILDNVGGILNQIPSLFPLVDIDLGKMVGRRVFGVVYDTDINLNISNEGVDLSGITLGTVAFKVVAVQPSAGSLLASVEIEILDIFDEANFCGAPCVAEDGPEVQGTDFVALALVADFDGGPVSAATITYSWTLGAYLILYDDLSIELYKFNTGASSTCTNQHTGGVRIASSNCGLTLSCESTQVTDSQPQFFVDPNNGDFELSAVTFLYGATRVHTGGVGAVAKLYTNLLGAVVRAEMKDGRIITFLSIGIQSILPEGVFDIPVECACARNVDTVLVVETGDVNALEFLLNVRLFLTTFASTLKFTGGASLGIIEYDGEATTRLAGSNSALNIASTINAMGSQCSGDSCGVTQGDIVVGIRAGIAALANADGAKVIVVVTNGWSNTDEEVRAVVLEANLLGIEVRGILFAPTITADVAASLNGDIEANVRIYWNAPQLGDLVLGSLTSDVCSLDASPCGDCCGKCDSVCGTCVTESVTCEPSEDCNKSIVAVRGCCVELDEPSCPEADGDLCSPAVCNLDGSCSYPTCSDLDDDCYTYECDILRGCVPTLRAEDTPCSHPSCVDGEIVFTPHQCPADTACYDYECDDTVELIPLTGLYPDPCFRTNYAEKPLVEQALCQVVSATCDLVNGWEVLSNDCNSDDLCVSSTCGLLEDGLFGCVVEQLCEADPFDLCDLNSCDPLDGSCTLERVVCADRPCEVGVCNSNTGECDYIPVTCPNDSCHVFECDINTGECAENELLSVCDVCEDDCGNNACQIAPCVDQVCGEYSFTVCTPPDHCFTSECSVEIGGCLDTPIDCAAVEPSSLCVRVIEDPEHEGCCREVEIECEPDNACGTSTCDLLEGCVFTPTVCTPAACEILHPDFAELAIPGCNVDTGLCQFAPLVCENDGCVEKHCVEGECVTESSANCDCSDLPNCVSDRCVTFPCERDAGNNPVCGTAINRDCAAENTDTCRTATGCDGETGCTYEPVVCDDADLPDACHKFIRDSSAEGCCVAVATDCKTSGPVANNKCEVHTGCNSTTGECTTEPVVCPDVSCKEFDTSPGFVNGCDPATGSCRYVPKVCANEGCNAYTCVEDECVFDNDDLCFFCEEPCVTNKCVESHCENQQCTEPVLTTCDSPDVCHTAECDPQLGCVISDVECPEPENPCDYYVKEPEGAECCVLKSKECPHDAGTSCYASSECNVDTGKCAPVDFLCDNLSTDCIEGQCTPTGCVTVPKAVNSCPSDPDDLCQSPVCLEDGTCSFEEVACTAPDACTVAECNPLDGFCTFVAINCDDNDECTEDSCEAGECIHRDLTEELCGSSDACSVATCIPATGTCTTKVTDCDDGFLCTRDSCDPVEGCQHDSTSQESQDICESGDVCAEHSCSPEHEDADENGCLYETKSCGVESTFCSQVECRPYVGCVAVQTDCAREVSGDDNTTSAEDEGCSLYFCNDEEAQCVEEKHDCVSALTSATVATAVGLGTAAVVGIVVGIVVVVALFAGGVGVSQVYANTDTAAEAPVGVNPLYTSAHVNHANPLFQQ